MCASSVSSGYAEKPMMLDAPVSGGVPAAEAGTLTFMVPFLASQNLLLPPENTETLLVKN